MTSWIGAIDNQSRYPPAVSCTKKCGDRVVGYAVTGERHVKKSGRRYHYYRCTHKNKKQHCDDRSFVREEKFMEEVKRTAALATIPDEWKERFLARIETWECLGTTIMKMQIRTPTEHSFWNLSEVSWDILDLESFASRLREPSPSDGVTQHLADQISAATKDLLRGYGGGPDALLQQALTDDLNRIIQGQPLLRLLRGKGVAIIWPPPGIPNQESLVPYGRMTIGQNRVLLEATYPQEIARRHGTRILRPLTDAEVWLLGKRGVDSEADDMLDAVMSWIINEANYEPKLSQRQSALLVDSIFQQAVVHPTHNTTQKALFLNWANLPGLEAQAKVAEAISRHASHCYAIKPNLAMTLEERAAEAQHIEEICRRAKKPNNLTDDECRYLDQHRPSSLAMARRMAAAVPFATDRWFVLQKRISALQRRAPEP
jgi:hypothetical protein